MPDREQKGPRERTNPFILIPLLLFGVYVIYLVVWLPFRYGAETGLVESAYRPPPAPDGEAEVFDYRQLRQPSADLIAEGARVYRLHCQSCHGPDGRGDGPASAGLTIKPRAFDSPVDEWRQGASVLEIWETLRDGVGAMPAMPALNPRQKFAVVHYVHDEFMEEWPEDSPEAIAALPEPAAGVDITIDPYAQPRVPLRYAMQKYVEQALEADNGEDGGGGG